MLALATGWDMEVERGPGCLLVTLGTPAPEIEEAAPLAEPLWSLMERYLVSRLVLDLSAVPYLDRHVLAQLVRLQRRIHDHGGLLRLTGLSPAGQMLVRVHGLNNQLPMYSNREEALMGPYPCQPR